MSRHAVPKPVSPVEDHPGSIRTYASGFIISIVLTLVAYAAVVRKSFSGTTLLVSLLVLAVVQLLVQLFFFLHVGRETKPRWRLLLLFLMIVVVLIVLLGSIWIMYNLNYRMSPDQINKYMQGQANGGL